MEHFWTFFSFPLNLLLAVLWMLAWGWLWKRYPSSSVVRFLLSPAATISAIALLILSCLWLGLSGDENFVRSLVFVFILLYIQTVVFLITLRGWKRTGGKIRWRFLLIHAGLLLALGAGYWGSPDAYELRVKCSKGESVREAYEMDGGRRGLGYELTVTDFGIEYSEEGQPSDFHAIVTVKNGKDVLVKVNKPYNVRFGEDIYLSSVTDSYCVLQIVHEPYRYFALVGIIMLLAGAFLLFIKGPRRC